MLREMAAREGEGEKEETRLDQLKNAQASTAKALLNGVMPGWFAEISEMWPGQVRGKKTLSSFVGSLFNEDKEGEDR